MENEFLEDDGMRQIRSRRRFQTGLVILLLLFCMDARSPRPYDARAASQEEEVRQLGHVIRTLPESLQEPGAQELNLDTSTMISGNWTRASSVWISPADEGNVPEWKEPIDATSGNLAMTMKVLPIRDTEWDPKISFVSGEVQSGGEMTEVKSPARFQGLFFHNYGRLIALGGLGEKDKLHIVWKKHQTPEVPDHVGEAGASNTSKMSTGRSGSARGDKSTRRRALMTPGAVDANARELTGMMVDDDLLPVDLESKADGQEREGEGIEDEDENEEEEEEEDGGDGGNEDHGKPKTRLSSRSEGGLDADSGNEAMVSATVGGSSRPIGVLELAYRKSTRARSTLRPAKGGDGENSPSASTSSQMTDLPAMVVRVFAVNQPGQTSETIEFESSLDSKTKRQDCGGDGRFMFTLQATQKSGYSMDKMGPFTDRMQGKLHAINCDLSAKLDVQITRRSPALVYMILFAAVCFLQMCLLFCRVGLMLAHRRYGRSFMVRQRHQGPKFDYHRPLPLDWDANQGIPETTRAQDSGEGRDLESGRCPECAICYAAVDATLEDYMLTPCDHVFHEGCLTRWMNIKMECPTCRHELPPPLD